MRAPNALSHPVFAAHALAALACAAAAAWALLATPRGGADLVFAALATVAAAGALAGTRGRVAGTLLCAVAAVAGTLVAFARTRPGWWSVFGLALPALVVAAPLSWRRDRSAAAALLAGCVGLGAALAPLAHRGAGWLDAVRRPTAPARAPHHKWRPNPEAKRGTLHGLLEAEIDLARGRPRWLLFGELGGRTDQLARLLRERHGVEGEVIDGCTLSLFQYARALAYDARITRWIEERHGAGTVWALREKASRLARLDALPASAEVRDPPRPTVGTPGWYFEVQEWADRGLLGVPPQRRPYR
jgi:hypothetical protein